VCTKKEMLKVFANSKEPLTVVMAYERYTEKWAANYDSFRAQVSALKGAGLLRTTVTKLSCFNCKSPHMAYLITEEGRLQLNA